VNAKQSAGYGVDVFNTADGSMIELFSAGVEPVGTPVWSPDGLRIVFQAQTSGNMELYMATVASNEFLRLTSTSAFDGEPVWTNQ
jgi:Tol biopolymer transport system component